MRLGEEIDMQTNAEKGSTGPATQTTDQLESKSDAPHLWNPTSAANSSLVLSQAFGAYLHAANWRVLGKPERAAANMRWFWATIVLLVMNAVLACFPAGNQIRQGLVFLAAVGLFFGWYFTEAKSQIRVSVRPSHIPQPDGQTNACHSLSRSVKHAVLEDRSILASSG